MKSWEFSPKGYPHLDVQWPTYFADVQWPPSIQDGLGFVPPSPTVGQKHWQQEKILLDTKKIQINAAEEEEDAGGWELQTHRNVKLKELLNTGSNYHSL